MNDFLVCIYKTVIYCFNTCGKQGNKKSRRIIINNGNNLPKKKNDNKERFVQEIETSII